MLRELYKVSALPSERGSFFEQKVGKQLKAAINICLHAIGHALGLRVNVRRRLGTVFMSGVSTAIAPKPTITSQVASPQLVIYHALDIKKN